MKHLFSSLSSSLRTLSASSPLLQSAAPFFFYLTALSCRLSIVLCPFLLIAILSAALVCSRFPGKNCIRFGGHACGLG
uniref:Uncharacterized protein n=1 Tax=Salix viminalis TaxID=40686 RepID=A0A6N2MFE6_SALVM